MSMIVKIIVLTIPWLILTDGSLSSLLIGMPFIVLAILVMPSDRSTVTTELNIRPGQIAGFLKYFIVESVRGGIDVSRRVFTSQPQVNPGVFDYPLRLQSAGARHLFINCISLLPGTLCADWRKDHAHIHSLEHSEQSMQAISLLEQRIGQLFGEKL